MELDWYLIFSTSLHYYNNWHHNPARASEPRWSIPSSFDSNEKLRHLACAYIPVLLYRRSLIFDATGIEQSQVEWYGLNTALGEFDRCYYGTNQYK